MIEPTYDARSRDVGYRLKDPRQHGCGEVDSDELTAVVEVLAQEGVAVMQGRDV
ncbi:hypothetical protein HYG77_34235 (plasmid) [Rhodococcus sp. ZPP]|uniref:hypothetical protein n=1 Tax=Rhodococcus sp. ZPP TaxID=2749906 RepID=UPI001AD8635F|nr:hypothetical protein [Rhodococcus sp. ZPP]QTJ70568.1 hypothetical protein HYG77_34235 [Rhodococcus sp. ZPP]